MFIITVAVCSHSRCCFGHLAWRESSTTATAFPLLLNLLHSLFQLILKYFVLRSITSCSPYRSLHLSESGGVSIPATCHVLMLEKGIRPFPLCYKEVSHILRRYLILHLPYYGLYRVMLVTITIHGCYSRDNFLYLAAGWLFMDVMYSVIWGDTSLTYT